MNDDEFQEYLDKCYDELEQKQNFLTETFGLGSFERYKYDFEKEEIYFTDNGITRVKAKIIPIGSFNTESKTWMWAWANEAFPEKLRVKSARLKELEDITGFEMFGKEMVEIEEDMAWEITGMAIHLLNYTGAYRGPANNTLYFYAMDEIEKVCS
jgi:hypothetical protein